MDQTETTLLTPAPGSRERFHQAMNEADARLTRMNREVGALRTLNLVIQALAERGRADLAEELRTVVMRALPEIVA